MSELNFVIEQNRIYAKENDKFLSKINYDDGVISHTFVDESLRGRGVASTLVKMAVEEIEKKGLKPSATCPYAIKWLRDNYLL